MLFDYCTLHNLEYMSADDLLYESDTQSMDCHTKLTLDQQDWLYMRTTQSEYQKCYKPYRTLRNY